MPMKKAVHGHARLLLPLPERAHLLRGLHWCMLTRCRELLHARANREKCYFNLQQLLGLALT